MATNVQIVTSGPTDFLRVQKNYDSESRFVRGKTSIINHEWASFHCHLGASLGNRSGYLFQLVLWKPGNHWIQYGVHSVVCSYIRSVI